MRNAVKPSPKLQDANMMTLFALYVCAAFYIAGVVLILMFFRGARGPDVN